ncbi:unnamed protein product [Clavelina lepadiformis]|uniref:Uncharacterized protein n=1 Tax=Clavelina lepadiformis TaxID=159417 RepID=A0ABP0F040_CLALP
MSAKEFPDECTLNGKKFKSKQATLYFIMECHPSDKHVEIILKESVVRLYDFARMRSYATRSESTSLCEVPTKTDATFTLMSSNVFSQSEIEEKPVFDGEVVVPENLNKRNLQEKYKKLATKFPDKNITNRESNTREVKFS